VEQLFQELEAGLTISGACGIADRLAEHVPSVVRDLRRAQIKVWMLTGDKPQTAIATGRAMKLLSHRVQLFCLRGRTRREVLDELLDVRDSISKKVPFTLVIEGPALALCVHKADEVNAFADMDLRNASLQSLFEALARKAQRSVWMYTDKSCFGGQRKTESERRKTESVWERMCVACASMRI
jgi:hypothetical protein